MSKALLHELGQSISFGRLSLKAKVLWPMLLAASDDQGRGIAEPDVIKWRVCPNVPEIELDEISELLQEMADQDMIELYQDDRPRILYQIRRWWEFQQLSWAQPSRFGPPDGWTDRVRYHKKAAGLVKEDWEHPGGYAIATSKAENGPSLGSELGSELGSGKEGGQPNLTQLNTTQPNLTTTAPEGGADAPPPPNPKPDPPETTNSRMTVGQQQFLGLWGGKRYKTIVQLQTIGELERKYGTTKLIEAGRWAAKKGMTVSDAVVAVEGALPNWGKPKTKGGEDGKGKLSDREEAEIDAWLETRRSAGMETAGAGAGASG